MFFAIFIAPIIAIIGTAILFVIGWIIWELLLAMGRSITDVPPGTSLYPTYKK